MTLRQLFDKHNCDKGSIKHRYDRCYEQDFKDMKDDHINVLEVGCFRGESISSWLEYFPNATIYTIDIFERTRPEDVKCLSDDRVKWIKASSMDTQLPDTIRSEWGDVEFDIIIDDGAHWHEANRLTFKNLVDFMRTDGGYYIEDVFNMDVPSVAMHPWVKRNSNILNRTEWIKFLSDLNGYTIKHYDFTSTTKEPDSAIIRITND